MKYFKMNEFEKSETADKLGINNSIPISLKRNIEFLCENVLDKAREYIGMPIFINSGYRSPLLNKAVNGVNYSQHLIGKAADITTQTRKNDLLMAKYIEEFCNFDQLIIYKSFIHVSYNSNNNRKEIIYKAR